MVIGTWRLVLFAIGTGPRMKNGRRRTKADTHRNSDMRRSDLSAPACERTKEADRKENVATRAHDSER
jgi:hypothetical protein